MARSELDFEGAKLRLSPSGKTWALSVREESVPSAWRLGRVDGSPLPEGSEEPLSNAMDLAFVDDQRLVLLRRESDQDGDGYVEPAAAFLVVRQSLGGADPRPLSLPMLGDYDVRLGAGGESWRVLTLTYDGGRHLLRRLSGHWGDDEIAETIWELGDAEEWCRGTAGSGSGALVVRSRYDFDGSTGKGRSQILALSPTSEERALLSTELGVTCEIHPPSASALCIARDRARTYLWRIEPAGGEPELVGSYRSPSGEVLLAADEGVLIRPPFGPPYWFEHDSGRLFELDMPAEGRGRTMAVSRTGLVAELHHARGGQDGSVLTIYRPEP